MDSAGFKRAGGIVSYNDKSDYIATGSICVI